MPGSQAWPKPAVTRCALLPEMTGKIVKQELAQESDGSGLRYSFDIHVGQGDARSGCGRGP